ncbi:hypothetical protein N7490_003089 [Penicillium lividum]|nr:hypothetical protein N7490_003089 [Penicillium lividum]
MIPPIPVAHAPRRSPPRPLPLRLHCTTPAVDVVVPRGPSSDPLEAVLSSRSVVCRKARSAEPMAEFPHMHLMSVLTGGGKTFGCLEMGPKVSLPDERWELA